MLTTTFKIVSHLDICFIPKKTTKKKTRQERNKYIFLTEIELREIKVYEIYWREGMIYGGTPFPYLKFFMTLFNKINMYIYTIVM